MSAIDLGLDILTALLLVGSGLFTLCAAVGVWTLPTFFDRQHPPALAYSAGAWTAGLAATIHFARLDGYSGLKALLIAVLLALSVPVTTMILARAGLFRERWQAREHDEAHASERGHRKPSAGRGSPARPDPRDSVQR
jgi:multicomponent K+:H+ antiporter subunit G